jgi:predicted permease
MWMLVGLFARKVLKADDSWIEKTNNIMFKTFFPVMLFYNMVTSDITQITTKIVPLIIFCLGGVLVTFAVLMFIVPRLHDSNPVRGAMVQATVRSNTALFGIPMTLAVYGEGHIAIIVILIATVVPLFNIISVFCLEYFRGEDVNWTRMLGNIAKNPLILSLIAGAITNILLTMTGASIPEPIMKGLSAMGNATMPLAFMVLGAGLSMSSAIVNRYKLTWIILVKLVISPILWVGLAIFLGFRDQYLAAVLCIFAPPTAVSAYTMAQAMESDAKLSNEAIVFTSSFAIVTIFFWVLILQNLGLL